MCNINTNLWFYELLYLFILIVEYKAPQTFTDFYQKVDFFG